MKSLVRVSSGLSRPMKRELVPLLFAEEYSDEYNLLLTIRFSGQSINVNELASYLSSIYKVDGLLQGSGYRSYVRTPERQIEITSIREGSVIVEIERLINHPGAYSLVAIAVFLRGLTQFLPGITQAVSNHYEAMNKREDYLEKREKRRLRKDVRRILLDDPDLVALSKDDKDKLVKLLGELYEANLPKLNAMVRFARKYVSSVTVRPKRR